MTKEQLSTLTDDVRIPTELLLERLVELKFPPNSAALSEDSGIAFFFESLNRGLRITADIEIHGDGSVSASIIPYISGPDGYDIYQSEEDPLELWDVEEPPPFEETIRYIGERLGRPLTPP